MLHDILIEPFRNGDYFIGFLFWVLFSVIVFLLLAGVIFIIDEYQWSKVVAFPQECVLLNQNYKSSTLQTHAVPVATGNGTGMGVVTTGEAEKYVTVWDCGKYGRLVADDKEIFRLAQEKSTLLIKERNGEYRISSILPI